MHDAIQLHPTSQGTSSCSTSSHQPTCTKKIFKNPKEDGVTKGNPIPPYKQTLERLITFLVRKICKVCAPIPSLPKFSS